MPSSLRKPEDTGVPMEAQAEDRTSPREALKKLREGRKFKIARATNRMKEQKKAMAAIKEELQKGEGTVPEIAAATGLETASVLWYLATMKKYGQVAEGAADGNYFRYRLAEGAPAEE
jgi:predicted transcriptional regulator